MATTSIKLNLVVTALEELATGLHLAAEPSVTHQPTGLSNTTLDNLSSPVVTKLWSESRALAAGADTIDLTALPRANLPNVDFAGLKVQVAVIHVLASASAAMTFSAGATNGYNLFGASGQVTLGPDDWLFLVLDETAPDVADGSADTIDVAGTTTEEYEILLAAG